MFNLVLDELLDSLADAPDAVTISAQEFLCPITAFIDDLVILFNSETSAQTLFNKVYSFLKYKGMIINIGKSRCLSTIVYSKRSVSRSKPIFRLDGEDFLMVQVLSPFEYLGHK